MSSRPQVPDPQPPPRVPLAGNYSCALAAYLDKWILELMEQTKLANVSFLAGKDRIESENYFSCYLQQFYGEFYNLQLLWKPFIC